TEPTTVATSPPAKTPATKTKPEGSTSVVAAQPPREIRLKAGDDVLAALASAPPGSTLVLADDGPFDLRPTPSSPTQDARPARRDLTLKAGMGAHPILRPIKRSSPSEGQTALLRFVGGRITLEDLEFLMDPGERD